MSAKGFIYEKTAEAKATAHTGQGILRYINVFMLDSTAANIRDDIQDVDLRLFIDSEGAASTDIPLNRLIGLPETNAAYDTASVDWWENSLGALIDAAGNAAINSGQRQAFFKYIGTSFMATLEAVVRIPFDTKLEIEFAGAAFVSSSWYSTFEIAAF